MFTDPKPHVKKGAQRVHRGEHLRLFYDAIVWKPMKYHIDDVETARNIIKNQCRDWPLMKFQFACCYAMVDLLEDRYEFDKIRRRTFKYAKLFLGFIWQKIRQILKNLLKIEKFVKN